MADHAQQIELVELQGGNAPSEALDDRSSTSLTVEEHERDMDDLILQQPRTSKWKAFLRLVRTPWAYVVVFLVVITLCALTLFFSLDKQKEETNESASHAIVISDHEVCSDIGRQILKDFHGNVVDAAIATAFCLGVVNPFASGLGGGGFLLVHLTDNANYSCPLISGFTEVLDFRETAPTAIDALLQQMDGDFERVSSGPLSIAIPGELWGLWEAHRRYGSLNWTDLVSPAARLARDGFRVSNALGSALHEMHDRILSSPSLAAVFSPRGNVLSTGDILSLPALADTLAAIAAAGGPDQWDFTETLAIDLAAAGALVTFSELRDYRPVPRRPSSTWYDGIEVRGLPPPAVAGAAVALSANIVERYAFAKRGQTNVDVHRTVEAMKYASTNHTALGDPQFGETDGAGEGGAEPERHECVDQSETSVRAVYRRMASKLYAAELRRRISDTQTYDSSHYGLADDENAQYDKVSAMACVADTAGNAAVYMSSLNSPFGSLVMSNTTGIILNNHIEAFSFEGLFNASNSEGSNQSRDRSEKIKIPNGNVIEPLKRPLSVMGGAIALYDGGVMMVIGHSASLESILQSVQIIVHQISYTLTPQFNIKRPRITTTLDPSKVIVEENYPTAIADYLADIGHSVSRLSSDGSIGGVNMIFREVIDANNEAIEGNKSPKTRSTMTKVDYGDLQGVCDPRIPCSAVGF